MDKIEIRFSDDTTYHDAVHDLFRRLGFGLKEPAWIEWKYRRNPDGLPLLVLALNGKEEVVGLQCYLPRTFLAEGRTVATVQALDAVTRPDYRRRGIYQRIWGESQNILRERGLAMTAYPSFHGMSIGALRKQGLTHLGDMRQLCRILRPAAFAMRRLSARAALRDNRLVRALDWAASAVLPSEKSPVRAVRIERFEKEECLPTHRIRGRRAPEYLNWRFVDNPMRSFVNIKFSLDGEDIGFCSAAILEESPNPFLYDFNATSHVEDCIRAAVGFFRAAFPTAGCLFCKFLEGNSLIDQFRSCGFFLLRAEQALFVANLDLAGLPEDKQEWHISLGDSDW